MKYFFDLLFFAPHFLHRLILSQKLAFLFRQCESSITKNTKTLDKLIKQCEKHEEEERKQAELLKQAEKHYEVGHSYGQ